MIVHHSCDGAPRWRSDPSQLFSRAAAVLASHRTLACLHLVNWQGMRPTPTEPAPQQVAEAAPQAKAPPKPAYYQQSVDRFGIVRWDMSNVAVDPAEEGARVYEESSGSGYQSQAGRYGISEVYEEGKKARLGGMPNQEAQEQYVPPSLDEYRNYVPPSYEPPMSAYGGPVYAPVNHPDQGACVRACLCVCMYVRGLYCLSLLSLGLSTSLL